MGVSQLPNNNWKFFENVEGTLVYSSALPSDWRAVAVKVAHASNVNQSYSFVVTRDMVRDGEVFRQGFYKSSSDCGRAHIQFSLSGGEYKIRATDYEINGGSQGTNTRMQIDYY